MTFHYNLTSEDRKKLVYTMAELLECKPRYLGMPTCSNAVGDYTVSKTGDITFDDMADSDEVEMLIEALLERGFEPEVETTEPDKQPVETEPANETPTEPEEAHKGSDEKIIDLVVSLPMDGFDAGSLNRLHTLVASKYTLLCKALNTDALPVQVESERVSFPWFHGEIDADHAQAYMNLIVQLCAMAKNSKRITAKDKPTDNDKYAFRCFLLRLGFIGDGFKRHRKILLENLTGSSAFRTGAPAADPGDVSEVSA